MLVKGDKLVVTKDVASFLRKGSIVKVVNVDKGIIEFAFGDGLMHMGVMNQAEYEANFEKYVERKSQLEMIDELLGGLETLKQKVLELQDDIYLDMKEELQESDCEEYCLCDDCLYKDCDCCEDCEECCEDEEEDECLDTDLDCDDCDLYDCPYNSNVYNR